MYDAMHSQVPEIIPTADAMGNQTLLQIRSIDTHELAGNMENVLKRIGVSCRGRIVELYSQGLRVDLIVSSYHGSHMLGNVGIRLRSL
jgi:hypothetical protein